MLARLKEPQAERLRVAGTAQLVLRAWMDLIDGCRLGIEGGSHADDYIAEANRFAQIATADPKTDPKRLNTETVLNAEILIEEPKDDTE